MDAETWEDEFYDEIEKKVPNEWVFCIDEALQMQERGAQYTQRTFGRFRCSGCKRWWNSAEIHVLFLLNRHLQQGTVKMRIFKQECKKCTFPKMEQPEISHENIKRITKNLVNRIVLLYYGGKKAKQDLKPEVYSREMEGPHDKEHCEACKLNVCRWQIVATKTQSEVRGSPTQMNPVPKPEIQPKVVQLISPSYASPSTATVVATKSQSEVRGSPAQMNPAPKPKRQPKAKHRIKSSYASPSTATYSYCNSGSHSTATYPVVATKTQSEIRGSPAQMNPAPKPKRQPKVKHLITSSYASPSTATYSYCSSGSHSTATYPVVATQKKSEVRGSSAQMNPTSKPKTLPKVEHRPNSSYASPSIETYLSYSSDLQSTAAYAAYESDFRSSPKYNTGRSAAHSPPSKGEESNFLPVVSLIAGIGALALWYLKR